MMTAWQILRQLVAIPSAFPSEERIARFCAAQLRKAGCAVTLQRWRDGDGRVRYNVLATKGPARRHILLYGHLDTVPAYNYGSRNPYRLRANGDRLTGLGCWDMKAGIALILDSVRQLQPTARMGVKVALGADEEHISEGAHRIAQSGFLRTVQLAIVPEIIDAHGRASRRGDAPVVLGRRGRVVYRVLLGGVSAHGAMDKGMSAISMAMRVSHAVERLRLPRHPFLGPCRVFVRKIQAESTSLALPSACELELDVHYVPPLTPQSLQRRLRQVFRTVLRQELRSGGNFSISIPRRRTPYLRPYVMARDHPFVRRFSATLRRMTPVSPRFAAGMTVADENVLAAHGIPCITWGPLGGEAHSSREWVSRKDFGRLASLYPNVLQQLL